MTSFANKSVAVSLTAAYAIAVVGVSIAAAGRMLLNQISGPHIPLVTLHLAVFAAGLCGGLGPALVSLVSGYLIAGLAFDAPRSAFGLFGMPDLWATAAYVVGGVAIAGSGTAVRSMHRQVIASEQDAKESRAELMRHLQQVETRRVVKEQPLPSRSQVGAPPVATTAARTDVPAVPAAEAAGTRARRVRVVDDDRDSADSLALLLKMYGYDVEVSYDGISALAADAPDVLIVDIDLPDISGYEIARRVRADPRFTRTLVVGLSGFGLEEARTRATSAGFDHYLTKPIDVVALRDIIDER